MANIIHLFVCESEDTVTNDGPSTVYYSLLVWSSMGCNPTGHYPTALSLTLYSRLTEALIR